MTELIIGLITDIIIFISIGILLLTIIGISVICVNEFLIKSIVFIYKRIKQCKRKKTVGSKDCLNE